MLVEETCKRRPLDILQLPKSAAWSPVDDVAKIFALRYALTLFEPHAEMLFRRVWGDVKANWVGAACWTTNTGEGNPRR